LNFNEVKVIVKCIKLVHVIKLYHDAQSTKDIKHKHSSYLGQDRSFSFKHTPQGEENKKYGVDE
jgi:hypothetical protein